MRPGQNKRMRGRPNNTGGNNRKGPNPLTRSYESNGPDVKIRGNAHHVAEKYLQLARDAQSSGDPVAAENYLQHAEHYFRLIATAQTAQAGFNRTADLAEADDDDDDSGLPDRFASPQAPAPAPFVPPAVQQQPYGERQTYGGGQPNGSGERQPYENRFNGERPAYAERNNYERPQRQDRSPNERVQDRVQDRGQDRNGLNRRPYRDNAEGGQERAPAYGQRGQERRGPDRSFGDRAGQDRNAGDRNGQDRVQDRGQDRGYDRQDRGQPLAHRDPQVDQPRDPYSGEQPRIESVERPSVTARVGAPPLPEAPMQPYRSEPVARPEPEPVSAPAAARIEPAPRAAPPEDAPGLPSFITTPTRIVPPEPSGEAPSLATATTFPGDGGEDAPKFPRRRRRTTRAGAAESTDAGTDLPVAGD